MRAQGYLNQNGVYIDSTMSIGNSKSTKTFKRLLQNVDVPENGQRLEQMDLKKAMTNIILCSRKPGGSKEFKRFCQRNDLALNDAKLHSNVATKENPIAAFGKAGFLSQRGTAAMPNIVSIHQLT